MRIALICPSNMLFMPYVKNYEQILIDNEINYEIINWDRFHIEETSNNKYKDGKIGHQRNYFEYLKYRKFVLTRLKSIQYDKVIIFGIQMAYFLKSILINNYKGRYVIDIRDHNKILHLFNIKGLIECSEFTVLSSSGFKEWLPNSRNFIINHNTLISNLNELKQVRNNVMSNEKINIAYIGAQRDLVINIDFINSVKNNKKISLYFNGVGAINNDIEAYLKENTVSNVYVTGRYDKEDEESLYEKNDVINVLRYNDGLNNKTALPNRLYNAVLYAKPLLAFEGSYLAEQVTSYNLGMVISSFDDFEQQISDYLNQFDINKYNKGRELFLSKVIEDNFFFKNSLIKFINHEYR